jgi:hypothetical protein
MLANSASMPSTVFLTIRPHCSLYAAARRYIWAGAVQPLFYEIVISGPWWIELGSPQMAEQTEPKRWTGGCQCGAVRYEWTVPPQYATVCHCRMCQKASGQAFMALTGGKIENLHWARGKPSIFKSSEKGERGFCSTCGTPLTYRMEGTGRISVTMTSLDNPEAIRPTKQYGVESKLSWTDGIAVLPAQRTEEWMRAAGMSPIVSHQHPDHETG